MTKIFLTNPPLNMAETPLQYHRPLIPMGLAYLGAMLEDRFAGGAWSQYVKARTAERILAPYRPSGSVAARDNMFLSFYDQYDYGALRDQIADFAGTDPELFIGLSILSDGMRAAKSLLVALRHDFPHAVLMVGGPHATFFPDDFYADIDRRGHPLVDFVVQNEGERAILGIVDGKLSDLASIERNGPEYGIDPKRCSLSSNGYRVIDGGQYAAPVGTLGAHVLDSLPPPALFLFEDNQGNLPYEPDRRYGLVGPAANINSSRGCPHKCAFCTIPSLVPGYRTLSPQRILEIIRFMRTRYNLSSLFFREDNFMYEGGVLAGARWADIEDLSKDLPAAVPQLKWSIEARADNLLQQTSVGGSRLELMKGAGLSGIYMGVEAATDAMLKLYVKGSSVHTMSEAIKACQSSDVAVVATACYGDSDLLLRRTHAYIDVDDEAYNAKMEAERRELLSATRGFMDAHQIPMKHREEYALVGIPVSALYRVLDNGRKAHPMLVEGFDPVTRYIFPKGFDWWASQIYTVQHGVRSHGSPPRRRSGRPTNATNVLHSSHATHSNAWMSGK